MDANDNRTGLRTPVLSLMMIPREIFEFGLLNVALTGLPSLVPMRVSVLKVSTGVDVEYRRTILILLRVFSARFCSMPS